MTKTQDNEVSLDGGRWIRIFGGLSAKDKRFLKKYYKNVYPRKYVDMLVATLEEGNVQSKEAQYRNM